MNLEVIPNRLFEFFGTAVDAASDLLFGHGCEEPLHHIDPGGAGRGEVDMEAWPLRQPAPDQRGLVGP